MKKYLFSLLVISIIACSKGEDTEPYVDTPMPPDTLGAGWTYIPFQKSLSANDIFFINDTFGFAAGASKIFRSKDGGITWDSIYNKQTSLFVSIGMGDVNHAIFVLNHPDLAAPVPKLLRQTMAEQASAA